MAGGQLLRPFTARGCSPAQSAEICDTQANPARHPTCGPSRIRCRHVHPPECTPYGSGPLFPPRTGVRPRRARALGCLLARAMVVQRKTQRPVQFELTEPTRAAVAAWVTKAALKSEHYLFPSRLSRSPHVSTRQYARIVHQWVAAVGLDSTVYGTHTMRRTKATLIYRRTKNLRAVQLLLGHSKLESTVRYLGIEVDDALEISEQTEI